MSSVSLVHTRWPKDEFIVDHSVRGGIRNDVDDLDLDARNQLYKRGGQTIERVSGLWGTMIIIVGGEIRLARFDHAFRPEDVREGERVANVTINNRPVHLVAGGEIESSKLYTTVQRYRTNSGAVDKWGHWICPACQSRRAL